jgi:hypothetical protein
MCQALNGGTGNGWRSQSLSAFVNVKVKKNCGKTQNLVILKRSTFLKQVISTHLHCFLKNGAKNLHCATVLRQCSAPISMRQAILAISTERLALEQK